MSRCDIGSKSDEPCHGRAAYLTHNWARCDELNVCGEHAREALSDGAEVTDLDGDSVASVAPPKSSSRFCPMAIRCLERVPTCTYCKAAAERAGET